MAASVLLQVKFTLNSVNLSAYTTSASLSLDAEDKETTAFGSTYKSRIGGLKDGKLDLEFLQDLANSATNQTIYALLGTVVAFTLKYDSGTTTTTNPEYQGSVLVTEYPFMDGGVGDLATVKVSWPTTGTLTYATS